MKDADENFKIDLEIKGYDSFEKNIILRKKVIHFIYYQKMII